jgi:hypothetical protein
MDLFVRDLGIGVIGILLVGVILRRGLFGGVVPKH